MSKRSDVSSTIFSLVILAAFGGLITCAACPNVSGLNKRAAEEHAAEWATSVGLKADQVVCGSSDTDGDGYVSCSFNVGDDVRTYECAGWTLIMPHDGCREPKVRVPTRR